MVASVKFQCNLTCPACGQSSEETKPSDACLWFYDCKTCGEKLKPKTGDCCVFCSYGDLPCPPVQRDARCGEPWPL